MFGQVPNYSFSHCMTLDDNKLAYLRVTHSNKYQCTPLTNTRHSGIEKVDLLLHSYKCIIHHSYCMTSSLGLSTACLSVQLKSQNRELRIGALNDFNSTYGSLANYQLTTNFLSKEDMELKNCGEIEV